ncbi:6382_t:CDS:2 [Diversispora eburnea]|uniref:6382_t:CDS:1 n=1 Tax=Diversispora eburnea TaxID=1213867 RepID=A0A9N8ZC65_9GLOM|nr:6382_t:CDS:2 [Diversispora eburnea]
MVEIEKSNISGYTKKTYKFQDNLPKLPIPPLEDTINRYLAVVKPLQDHEQTIEVAKQFLENEGPELQEKLKSYAYDKSSYIEEFWYDSYLNYSDPVVLNLNPFFLLEDDPTPARNNQVERAASLITSSLKFVHALRTETLEPDFFRGSPLCMSQFQRMFGTARLPTENGCRMNSNNESKHIIVLCRGQFYWFDVLTKDNEVGISKKELVANLKTIKQDALSLPVVEIAKNAVGILSTENRKIWANLRRILEDSSENNKDCLNVLDSAIFVVCLDEGSPSSLDEVATNMLCGTYDIKEGVQVGTCANRWYDKLQIIVCENGSAGVNFEHTGVDGHTVLRFVSDIYTDTIIRFAQTINSHTKSLLNNSHNDKNFIDTAPKKLEWNLTPEVRIGIRFAETRLSDLILQNETKVLEYENFGKSLITSFQMTAYYGLYGTIECTYEPAMTKTFIHGRTEAIRPVTLDAIEFVKLWWSDASTSNKLKALRKAIHTHVNLTKMCSKGLGQDRHLYALQCVWQREIRSKSENEGQMPAIFGDVGWQTLNHTVISTKNYLNNVYQLLQSEKRAPGLKRSSEGENISVVSGYGYFDAGDYLEYRKEERSEEIKRVGRTLNLVEY